MAFINKEKFIHQQKLHKF